jgi:hypothetical protein
VTNFGSGGYNSTIILHQAKNKRPINLMLTGSGFQYNSNYNFDKCSGGEWFDDSIDLHNTSGDYFAYN